MPLLRHSGLIGIPEILPKLRDGGSLILLCLALWPFIVTAGETDSTVVTQPAELSVCQDAWFGRDKFHHFTTSALFACAGTAVAYSADQPRSDCISWGAGFSFSLGLGKEYYDMKQPDNHFCWKDIVADLLGIAFGVWIMEQWS